MVWFMVYLFETGLCLSLLYLAYWLFLRKETYFNFNRVFLTGSILLALTVPLLHLNFIIPQGSSFENPALGIVKFRNYYEELIRMSDADFGAEPAGRHGSAGRTADLTNGTMNEILPGESELGRMPGEQGSLETGPSGDVSEPRISAARLILIIYITGVIYFFARFFYLLIRLCLLALRNGVNRQGDFRVVEIKEDISPFSFFRFLFINHGSFNESELQNLLAHERAHIMQKHSLDHLFAHGLAIFQWFNPFAWQIRNALKTTHEYIADRKVLEGGFELVDYQSLLLRQVIGYHSVELVNNFNLKPIKKRIAMMTKTRSGIPARLKTTLVIPFALAIFLLTADFSLKGPGNDLLNQNPGPDGRAMQESLTGLWERYKETRVGNHQGEVPGDYHGEIRNVMGLLFITADRFSYLEGLDEVREYFWRLEPGNLVLSTRKDAPGIELKIDYNGENLNIWLNDSRYQTYRKTGAKNTLDLALSNLGVKIDLPEINQYRIMEKRLFTYYVSLGYRDDGSVALLFNFQPVAIGELEGRVEEYRADFNKLDQPQLTAMLWVDKDMPMGEVVKVKEELRRANSLKIADGGYPWGSEHTVSPLLYSRVALPRLLPPPDAERMDKKEVEKQGIKIFTIDLSARNTTPADVERNLEQFIRENEGGKYIFSLEYDRQIPYAQYIESVDMVFNVVYRFRKELSMRKFQVPYDKLGDELQKEMRKAYPMVLSEAWSGR
jgi:biopolymer transport protein ExbD